jgi:hypothetical protein
LLRGVQLAEREGATVACRVGTAARRALLCLRILCFKPQRDQVVSPDCHGILALCSMHSRPAVCRIEPFFVIGRAADDRINRTCINSLIAV